MRSRVAALVEERGRLVARLSELPVDGVAVRRPTSCCSDPSDRDGAEVWQALLDQSVLVRDCSSWPRLDGCLRVTIGTPPRTTPSSPPWRTLSCMTRAASQGADHQGDEHLGAARPRRPHRRRVGEHRAPVLRPHARPARSARRLRPGRAGDGRPARRRPPHRRGRRHHPRRGVPRGAGRQGRHPPLRQRALPARRGARRGRPRPVRAARSPPTTCPSARCCRWAIRRSTRRWPSTSGSRSPRPPGSPCTCACARAATRTTSSRPASRACALPARRRAGGGRRHPVHQGRRLSGACSSRCSTTRSGTSGRPRRRSSTSAPTRGSRPIPA